MLSYKTQFGLTAQVWPATRYTPKPPLLKGNPALTFFVTRLAGWALAASVLALLPAAHAQTRTDFSNEDDIFLALREAARRGDAKRAEELAALLPNYPIPSYVDYYQLRTRIDLAPQEEIRAYLARYQGTAIADRLRNDWLLELGRKRDWQVFDEQYLQFVLDDDTQVRCYALASRASKGEKVAGDARALLVTSRYYGEACPALIEMLVENGQFDADDAWAQARLAAEDGQRDVLQRMAPALGVAEATLLRAYEKPLSVIERAPAKSHVTRELFLLALGRAARSDPGRAVEALNKYGKRLGKQERAIGWAQIALQASYKLLPEAGQYWARSAGAPLSHAGHQWKARIALRDGDWKTVRAAIEAMPATLRRDSTWIYWMGRAHAAAGEKEAGQRLYESIAEQNGFYGKLALEELGLPIIVPPRAAPLSDEELAPMVNSEGFRRAFKFFKMNLRFEGVREWNWELRGMNERQLIAAAEFARQNDVLDRMVSTSDRTRSEFDFDQRFPTPFREVMAASTDKLGLDMAWVYGLIRQESRFVQNARSHVGASGLMQLMPGTARWVARKIGLGDFRLDQVDQLETNITLGTHYLNMVLQDLGGSQALATAAYNAGPRRPRAWRATLARPVEGAIFAESIPFTETRDYVKKVLSNATYYAALFEGKPQSLKARLGTVAPNDDVSTDLP